ncbi:NACHT domain-containing protein [Saccharothrix xinjiangensis]|uniref:NACHT domain-containing protein n=1 Tax=Saccharothrix xinjiangensis TaxID=204798 RepID=A0ABV9XR46_9PSEU
MGVEAVLIPLGASVVRSALKLWLGDKSITAAAGGTGVDLLERRLTDTIHRRKALRVEDRFVEAVVERVQPIVEVEHRRLPEHERLAAVRAVKDTFDGAALDDDDLFAVDLDAPRLDRHLRSRVPDATDGLSQDAVELYGLLLRESAGYVIDMARTLPMFGPTALTEVLRRESEIVDEVREVLSRLPQRRDRNDFSHDYRQLVVGTLDHVEVFGATLSEASRRYPLSVAYISLTADSSDRFTPGRRVEDLLAAHNRLFIRGEAGLGKTTLLRWIAVRSARHDFAEPLTAWNGTVPFLVPLRRYADRELPAAGQFLDEVGRHIADEMPAGWVQQQLRSGLAVVLVDGVDELAVERRGEARAWLRSLVLSFPEARFVVTSRPSAVDPDWLAADGFAVTSLRPMTHTDVRVFVDRWHAALAAQVADEAAKDELEAHRERLTGHFAERHHLRRLAGYPLLCALLCALHRDRRGDLPGNRMELYDTALQMLLERRDAERRLDPVAGLSRTRKTLLLSDLAYWFIRNDLTDAPAERVVAQIDRRLPAMPEVAASGEEVYRHLLERSGLLREPVHGRVDFVHRTFQEYLAAKAAIDDGDVGTLVSNAHRDQWHEVVVMAVGHASRAQRDALLGRLVENGDREPGSRPTLHLLAVACLETAPELEPSIREAVQTRAERLLPPRSLAAAESFSSAGPFVLDLLAAAEPRDEVEAAATVRAAGGTGLEEALPLLAAYGRDDRAAVQRELLLAWWNFDPDDYAATVLADLALPEVEVTDPAMARGLRHLGRVERITCNAPPGPLDFIPSQVTALTVVLPGRADLDTLRTPGLRDLVLTAAGDLDVTRLGKFADLRSARVRAYRTTGLAALRKLPELRSLALRGGVLLDDLAGVRAGWPLRSLELSALPGVADLDPFGCLSGPEELSVSDCRALFDIGVVERWAGALERLRLRDCGNLDLRPVAALDHLRELDLAGTTVIDLRPLARLPRLEALVLSGTRDARFLEPIAELPGLREIRFTGEAPVNLSALAGASDLRVRVRGALRNVIGAESLGGGVRVEPIG